jgi:hypothetical protein
MTNKADAGANHNIAGTITANILNGYFSFMTKSTGI